MVRPDSTGVDYAHLPGEEENPLMESTAHVDWAVVLLNAARHSLADTDDLVTGNVPFAPDDGLPHGAPDLMVIPGARGRSFGRYQPGPDDPLPTVCVEIRSPSNSRAVLARRCRRLLRLGVAEVYVLDPLRQTIDRVTLDGDDLVASSAIGLRSPGLNLTFVRTGSDLAVCCPAGRVVRPGDDPFGWLVEEARRADVAELRADTAETLQSDAEARRADAEARRAEIEARVHQLEAELDRLRRSTAGED